MKIFLTIIAALATQPAFSQDLSHLYGKYVGTYKQNSGWLRPSTRSVGFELTLGTNRQISFTHPDFGRCTSGDKAYNQFRLYQDRTPLVLWNFSPVVRAWGVIFCDDESWYILNLEMETEPSVTGEEIISAFYLQDSHKKIILETEAILHKVD
jgi:hypothetical protein